MMSRGLGEEWDLMFSESGGVGDGSEIGNVMEGNATKARSRNIDVGYKIPVKK